MLSALPPDERKAFIEGYYPAYNEHLRQVGSPQEPSLANLVLSARLDEASRTAEKLSESQRTGRRKTIRRRIAGFALIAGAVAAPLTATDESRDMAHDLGTWAGQQVLEHTDWGDESSEAQE